MLAKVEKKRPLSRYLKDFKHTQTHCCQCGKPLDRMTLVFRGQIINKEAIAGMDQLVDDAVWLTLSQELTALCRFCSVISCDSATNYFDIKAFKQYLFEQTAMSHSTIREYVVRLRRLDEILATCNYPHDKFSQPSGSLSLIEDVPDAGRSNYRIALRKYDQYLNWQRNF
ncbi:flagella biosynthesis regulatory protein FliZ [Acerihabitans sp. TG2]|uniref:flagella biosynthesis regulatory protein FliZ n=1 Tax=Acerihabitans sp. TG2 TaxID=3096008 RepID=UPI002B230814|nr:flagella biosynthesis regulatory protein FliZ [Acerihabitans sp. TG2]MEA9392573.1 flagella biosynthesis regulatory protein FliZ [Acerihabitans sp. TG2]